MTLAPAANAVRVEGAPAVDVEDDVHKRADKLFLIGAVACGTFLLGPIGLGFLIAGYRAFRSATLQGRPIRDWMVTLIAVFCLVDASMNMVGWSIDAFAHDTVLGETLWSTGYGYIVDAGYHIGYNTRSFGGTPLVSEKTLQLGAVLFLFPMRIACTWAFLKMKRWGLQGMIITSWMYAYLWLMYLVALALSFDPRLTTNLYGMLGWLGINIWFITPFLMLPYLYTVDRSRWT